MTLERPDVSHKPAIEKIPNRNESAPISIGTEQLKPKTEELRVGWGTKPKWKRFRSDSGGDINIEMIYVVFFVKILHKCVVFLIFITNGCRLD
jgi:hypothetical protein